MSKLTGGLRNAIEAHVSATFASVVWTAGVCILGLIAWLMSVMVGVVLFGSSIDFSKSLMPAIKYFLLLSLVASSVVNVVVLALATKHKLRSGESFSSFYEEMRRRQLGRP